jgi:hypothetical protein
MPYFQQDATAPYTDKRGILSRLCLVRKNFGFLVFTLVNFFFGYLMNYPAASCGVLDPQRLNYMPSPEVL